VILLRSATWLVLLATAAPAFAQDAPALADQGRRIYTSLCVRCHGLNLVSNGIGFDLRQFPKDGQERFRNSVSKGLRAMPAWEGVLKPGELDALWAYIGSVNHWD
jgi:cytochrome c55X